MKNESPERLSYVFIFWVLSSDLSRFSKSKFSGKEISGRGVFRRKKEKAVVSLCTSVRVEKLMTKLFRRKRRKKVVSLSTSVWVEKLMTRVL